MNRELIAERCEAGGLSIHAAAMKAWVDPVVLWEDPGSEADDRIPLGVLRRLCSILDVDLTELVETRCQGPEDEDGDVFADDVRVEAALAEFDEGLSRDGLGLHGPPRQRRALFCREDGEIRAEGVAVPPDRPQAPACGAEAFLERSEGPFHPLQRPAECLCP